MAEISRRSLMIDVAISSSGRRVRSGAVVAQAKALEPQQPAHGALDDPTVAAELALVFDASAGNADLDPSGVQVAPTAAVVGGVPGPSSKLLGKIAPAATGVEHEQDARGSNSSHNRSSTNRCCLDFAKAND